MLPPLSVRTGLLLCFLVVIFRLPAGAQTVAPSGIETAVLGARNGEQTRPSLGISSTGGYLVWEDNAIVGSQGGQIAAVRIGPDLSAVGAPFQVNSKNTGSQEKPQTVMLSDGRALVSWESRAPGKSGIYARILSGDGGFATDEFQVSPGTTVTDVKQKVSWSGIFRNRSKTRKFKFKEKISSVREHAGGSALVALPDGGAVIVYHGVRRTYTNSYSLVRETKWNGVRSFTNDYIRPVRYTGDWMQDVFLQRIDASGQSVGGEVQVNQYDSYNQRNPAVTLLANGNLLIAWVSERPRYASALQNFSVSIYAREMTVSGEPVGDEFPVGEDATRASANPAVTAVGNGGSGFAVYWSQHEEQFSSRWNVYGRVFESANRPVGETVTVNVHTTGDQFAPRVASTGASQFIVWTSVGQDGSREGIYGRTLVNGLPSGDEIQVNSTVASRQYQPALAGDGGTRILAVWTGYTGETGFDLCTQIFSVTGNAQQ